MQANNANYQSKQKLNISNNPLKQLFSYNLSPKHKICQNGKQKLSVQSFELGNKYTYSYEDLIGDGYTSKVYKGYEIDRPNKGYAIKAIEKKKLNQDQMKLIRNEIQVHPKLDHKNIVKCYDVYDTPKIFYVVMELCPNGDLAQYISDFKEKEIPEWRAIDLMEQIIEGYRYLIQQGILHRDLKPPNILRAGNTLKIADFGFAVKGKKTLIDTMSVGTPLYMPPQSIQQCVYSHKSDFFALGCIMYEILHGKTPWYKNDEKALAQVMKKTQIDLTKIQNQNIRYFIEKACQISEGSRLTVDEFMSFNFRKAPMALQLNLSGTNFSQSGKKSMPRQKTDRRNKSKNSQQEMAKSTKSKKSQTAMQATFVSNHIYFKNAKCEETKKITAQFQEKFQMCLLLKYLIQNSENSILLEDFDKKNLKIVLFRHCIFILRKIQNDFVRTKSFDLQNWLKYKQSKQFKLFEEECKVLKEKMEKEFNLQLKGMSLKNLSQVNKRFPELSGQFELSKGFYEKLKQFLRDIMKKFHLQILKRFQKNTSLLSPLSTNMNSQNFEAFKSLYRYYEITEQKLTFEEQISKSTAFNTSLMKTSTTVFTTATNSKNDSSNMSSTGLGNFREGPKINIKKVTLSNDCGNQNKDEETNFGKKGLLQTFHHYTYLSPQHDGNCNKLYPTSPKMKTGLNKTSSKKFYNTNANDESLIGSQYDQAKQQKKHHHYYAYSLKPTTDDSTQMGGKSPKPSIYYTGNTNTQCQRQQNKVKSVQNHFSQVLCRNYAQSKMTKEEFITIKKKIKWLW